MLPDDGSFVIRNMSEHFKYFIILTTSKNYIFVHLLDNKVFNHFNRFMKTIYFALAARIMYYTSFKYFRNSLYFSKF